jgi:hypothetical protein
MLIFFNGIIPNQFISTIRSGGHWFHRSKHRSDAPFSEADKGLKETFLATCSLTQISPSDSSYNFWKFSKTIQFHPAYARLILHGVLPPIPLCLKPQRTLIPAVDIRTNNRPPTFFSNSKKILGYRAKMHIHTVRELQSAVRTLITASLRFLNRTKHTILTF